MKLPAKTKTQELAPSAAVRGAFDLKLTPESVARLREIEEIKDYAVAEARIASKIAIIDDETNAMAADAVVNLTKARKALEDLQKYFTSPLEAAKKSVIATFKKIGVDALGQEERLRREAETFFMEKENARRKAEADRIAREQAEQRKARALGRQAPAAVAAPVEEVQRTTAAENGAMGMKLVWGFDVTDDRLVPRQYLKIDEAAIRAAVATGVREIPGVMISERAQSSVR